MPLTVAVNKLKTDYMHVLLNKANILQMTPDERAGLLACHRKKLLRGKHRKIRYSEVATMENIRAAEHEARKGKGCHLGVRRFDLNPEGNLTRIVSLLMTRTYHTSPVEKCVQKCPCGKERELSKVPHDPDHIIHHGGMRVIMPYLMRYFYQDSAASIKGRGMHYAARRTERYIDEHRKCGRLYYIKRDFVKFYHNIRQPLIYQHLCNLFGDAGIRYLLYEFVTACDTGLGIGLFPIQPLANTYTSPLCRILMARFKVRILIYCDDIVIISDDKREVWKASNFLDRYAKEVMQQPLHEEYGMQIIDEDHFLDFVGYRYYFGHTGLRKKMKRKFQQKMHRLKEPLRRYQVATAYKGWLMHCDGMNLWRSVMGVGSYKAIKMPTQKEINLFRLRQAA